MQNDPFFNLLIEEAQSLMDRANEAGPENADSSYVARAFARLADAAYRRLHPNGEPDFDLGAMAQTAEAHFARRHQQWFIAQTANPFSICPRASWGVPYLKTGQTGQTGQRPPSTSDRWPVLLAGFSAIWPVFQAGLSNGLANAFNGLSVVLASLDGFTDKRQFPARTNAHGVKNGQFFRIKAGNWPV